MKKKILIAILLIITIFVCVCYNTQKNMPQKTYSKTYESKYGSYLAGRVAHIRKDFNKAAQYYAKTTELGDDNIELLNQIYIIYASVGDLNQASKYARKLQEKGDENSFLTTIIAVDEVKKGNYENVIKTVSKSDVPIYSNFINPLILAWAYAGKNDMEQSINKLKILKKSSGFEALYNFQIAMIYDYFNMPKEAQKYFDEMATTQQKQLSFRAIQIMTNFYLRQDQKQKAIKLVSLYKNDELFAPMLNKLLENIKVQNKIPQQVIDTPSKGLAESLFSIAATIRSEGQNPDLAHIFASMALYSNPKYDLAKLLLADILEDKAMYLEANDIYQTINKDSEAYEISLRKKAQNFSLLEDYKNAEKTFRELTTIKPKNMVFYSNLADALRMQNNCKEAINYYNKAIDTIDRVKNEHWVLYYSLGACYEILEDWHKAEKNLLKALDLSSNHYMVENYLGYSWINRGSNADKAFGLIVDAYQQMPNDGNIADSLGYALYKLGYYDKAVQYLEEAVLIEPNNPIILEHLGDAYYLAGRKNEAKFQWQQSLSLDSVEDTKDYNPSAVEEKIKNGFISKPLTSKDKSFIEDKIKELEE